MKILLSILLLSITSCIFASEGPSVEDVTRQVSDAANNYAKAISCGNQIVGPDQIAALVPYKKWDERYSAKFAVIWSGDIGCAGGSGTTYSRISIIKIGTGDTYLVDPEESSPIVTFDVPVRHVERIVGNTDTTLVLEGMKFGPDDPNCCPSIKVRFTLQADEKGNWTMIKMDRI